MGRVMRAAVDPAEPFGRAKGSVVFLRSRRCTLGAVGCRGGCCGWWC